METTERTEVKKLLFWRDAEAENKIIAAAEATATALNDVYSHYKFKTISEIPVNVSDWVTKRTLETNPALAQLAKVHKLETLNHEVPGWIQETAQAFNKWHAVKNSHSQYLQYCDLVDDRWIVNHAMLEQEFASSPQYRKYLTNDEQFKRLEHCKKFISFLRELDITYPDGFNKYGIRSIGNPWVRVIQRTGDYVPNMYYVLDGSVHLNAPMYVDEKSVLTSILE